MDLGRGRHVCWVVDDDSVYDQRAAAFLCARRDLEQKRVAFGRDGSRSLQMLERDADLAADPRLAFLDGGTLDAERMFAGFRRHSALARAEGHTGLRVVADMDWLLAAEATPETVIGFELLLDRLIVELDATVVCAYRRRSFEPRAISGFRSVHPLHVGCEEPPAFSIVAAPEGTWRLFGEVDAPAALNLAAALSAVPDSPCVIDVSGLEFIDVAGMRTIAEHARTRGCAVELRHARASVARYWRLSGFDEYAPTVRIDVR